MRWTGKSAGLWAALALAACGGGDAPPQADVQGLSLTQARPASAGMPLAADVAQAPQASSSWSPNSDALMQWAEQAYPQHFPTGPFNRFYSPYVYRLYPQTGNILGVAGEGVYILGPVSGGVLTLVGRLSDFTCAINPSGCAGAAPLPRIAAPASSGPATQAVQSDVTAVLRSPARIDAQVVQGEAMTGVTLQGAATGNLAVLNGRTLFIIVEDPHGLFQATPSVSLSSSNVIVGLSGKAQPTAGLMEGTLKIHACLDAQCRTALGGSPLLLPYSVSVLPPLSVGPASVSVSVPFGQLPAPRNVQVNLPPYTTGWSASIVYTGFTQPVAAVSNSLLGNTVGNIALNFAPATPGTTNHTLRITGGYTLPSGRSSNFSQDVPITYAVTPAGAPDYVISPAETFAPMKYGDNLNGPTYPRTVAGNTGVTVRLAGIEYLSAPAAAGGNPKSLAWWSELNAPEPSTCNGLNPCLPPGTYTARIRYTVTRSGAAGTGTSVYHPVTMQVYP